MLRTISASMAAVMCGAVVLASAAQAPVVPDSWGFRVDRVAVTYGRNGMVSTTDRVASEVGVEVLRRGGNAVDAGVATNFALAVINPEAGNIGGGGLWFFAMLVVS